jgi:hypothetical protein
MANRIEPATIYSGADMLTTANPLYAQVSYSSKAILTRMQYECSGSRNIQKMMASRTKNNEHPVTPPPMRNERMVVYSESYRCITRRWLCELEGQPTSRQTCILGASFPLRLLRFPALALLLTYARMDLLCIQHVMLTSYPCKSGLYAPPLGSSVDI